MVSLQFTGSSDADGFELTDNKKVLIKDIEASETALGYYYLFSLTSGSHSLYVQPYILDPDGNRLYGTYSKVQKVTVKIAWMTTKPVVTLTQTDENEVLVSWKEISDVDGYYVYEYDSKAKTYEQKAKVSGASNTAVKVDGLEYGKHSFTVQAYHVNSLSVEDLGTMSAAKAITTAVLWNQAPTLTVVQASDDTAYLTWTSKLQAESYNVYGLVGKKYERLGNVNGMSFMTNAEDFPMVLNKSYKFMVYPVKDGEEGKPSKAVSLKIVDAWKIVYDVKLEQLDKEAALLKWKSAAPVNVDYFLVYVKIGKKFVAQKVETPNVVDGYLTFTIDDQIAGFDPTAVQSAYVVSATLNAKGKQVLGTKSATVTLTLDADYSPYKLSADGKTLLEYSGIADSFTVPEGVTAIAAGAFEGNTSLATIDLNDVETIGEDAFKGCTSLETVTGTENVTKVESGAFEGYTYLDLSFVDDLPEDAEVEESAFAGITESDDWKTKKYDDVIEQAWVDFGSVKLTWEETDRHITFHVYASDKEGYETLGTDVREYTVTREETTEVTITIVPVARDSQGQTVEGEGTQITVSLDKEKYTVNELEYQLKDGTVTVAKYYGSDASVTVDEKMPGTDYTVTAIGPQAFKGNTTLKSIDLPDTIELIDEEAFADCTALCEMK